MYCAYLFAIFFTAAATAKTTNECFAEHIDSILVSSTCADKSTLAECLSHIERYEKEHLQGCYEEAGCNFKDGEKEVALAMKRCRGTSDDHELKRRDAQSSNQETAQASTGEATSQVASDANESSSQASNAEATKTEASAATSASAAASSQVASTDASTAASSAATAASTTLVSSTTFSSTTASSTIVSSTKTTTTTTQTGPVFSDEACFETTKSWTNICELDVTGIHTKTVTCAWGEVTSSSCSTNMICTTNARGDICMVTRGIETDGIVVAVVFATLFVMLFGGVCLASALDNRKQKRLAARAEAAAIAREAAAKKPMLSDY